MVGAHQDLLSQQTLSKWFQSKTIAARSCRVVQHARTAELNRRLAYQSQEVRQFETDVK